MSALPATLRACVALAALGGIAAPVAADPLSQWDDTSRLILVELNKQREFNSLPALTGDSRLHNAAEAHSADMLENDFFSHNSPSGSTIGSRARDADYDWTTVAENIFFVGNTRPINDVDAGRISMYGTEFLSDLQAFADSNASLETVNSWDDVGRGWSAQDWMNWDDELEFGGGWMGSDSHRPNILRSTVDDVGVGYAFSTDGGYLGYMTQLFAAGDSQVSAVPLPAAAWMLLGALGVLLRFRRAAR